MNTRERIEKVRLEAPSYTPNGEILQAIQDKEFVAVMGPAGAGKSTTLDIVSQLDPAFGRTGSVLTRQPEARDNPDFCKYMTVDKALKCIENRELVNYIVHPTTGTIYGTDLDMFAHEYNMLETLPGAINYFRELGFKAMHILYLVTEADSLEKQFDERYTVKNDERTKRLNESRANVEWSLSPEASGVRFIYNQPGKQAETAQKIIHSVKYNQTPHENGREYAEKMLAKMKEME